MADYIVAAIIVLLLFVAFRIIIKNKNKGIHCIGCPYSNDCNNNQKCSNRKEKTTSRK